MKAEELAAATAEFDREMIVSESRPLTAAQRRAWEAARRSQDDRREEPGSKSSPSASSAAC